MTDDHFERGGDNFISIGRCPLELDGRTFRNGRLYELGRVVRSESGDVVEWDQRWETTHGETRSE